MKLKVSEDIINKMKVLFDLRSVLNLFTIYQSETLLIFPGYEIEQFWSHLLFLP